MSGPAKANGQAKVNPGASAQEIYDVYRDYILHEDELIHQRTTWSTTIQGFMVTGFGIAYPSRVQQFLDLGAPAARPEDPTGMLEFAARARGIRIEARDQMIEQAAGLLSSIAALGIGVAIVSFFALLAAVLAIHSLKARLQQRLAADPKLAAAFSHFPDLTGGGRAAAQLLGFMYPLMLPALFVVFWWTTAHVAIGGFRWP